MTDLHVNIVCDAESHNRDDEPLRVVHFDSYRFEGSGANRVVPTRTYMMPGERTKKLRDKKPEHFEIDPRDWKPPVIEGSSGSGGRNRGRFECPLCKLTVEVSEMTAIFPKLRAIGDRIGVLGPSEKSPFGRADTRFANVNLTMLAAIVASK